MFAPSPPRFESLESDVEGARRALVVLAALDLGLFEALAGRVANVEQMAGELTLHPSRLRPLVEALAGLGYLVGERGDGEAAYSLAPSAAEFLVAATPGYRGDELLHWQRVLRGWSWLAEVVRRNSPRYVGSLDGPRWPSRQTHRCLTVRARDSARALFDAVGFEGERAVLDVGGGSGGYAEALVEALPEATVTLLDLPDVVELARGRLEGLGLLDRIRLVAGDLFEGLPPGPFDLVLVANVLHIYGAEAVARVVAESASALRPGGRLVVRDGIVDDGREGPLPALLFGVHMAVFSRTGRVYSASELCRTFEDAGLVDVRWSRLEPDREGGAVVGRRP